METHPTEEQLERFLLHRSAEDELESLETHILACESCVVRLEDLETHIAATKLALREMQREQTAKAAARQRASWKHWFGSPKLSLAGALAVLAVGVFLVPQLTQNSAPVANGSLSAYRGSETSILPADHRLHVQLNVRDLADGPVLAKLVDSRGSELWKQVSAIHSDLVDVTMPPIHEKGAYFVRLYSSTRDASENDLLREFYFQVK